ncbi:MAG: HAMP domain-containing histidine kinase [Nanoarchaeota archaeon]|nr:HAMP domain-containing histidine kinase [DPANN group archaeon]MBL7116456.1 HAMP domain-containing histidine kinase [Nanoarchaeota archaeon]
MNSIEIIIWVYHSINRFMATDSGELFKKFVELFLFATVAYMIASEYGRSKELHLKYLLIGFSALALDKLIMSFVFALIVFGNVQLLILNPFLPILDLFLEIFALVLLTNSFIFPIFADKVDSLKRKITKEIFFVIIIVLIIEAFWLVRVTSEPTAAFRSELSYLVLELLKILVLYSPIYYILSNLNKLGRYGPHIMVAFVVYMITPIVNVVNVVFYGGINNDLRVFAHPFPFISVLLFTRVTYLKLVDKATLKRELAETKQKYVHEQELGKMKDEFVSTVSHELRTPLTSMKLYLALLKQKKFGKLSKKQLNAVGIVEKESDRLTNLIADILNLSRLESKKTRLRLEDADLCKLVKDNLYYNLAEQKGLEIKNKIPKKFKVKVDPEKFKQVFINLFSNAINYAKSRIIISVEETPDYWDFIVEDDGEGIPKEKLEKLFDKFYKVGDYITKDKKGTGLGLAIVKNIVELHNGEVWAESEEGKGTKFVVRIPR